MKNQIFVALALMMSIMMPNAIVVSAEANQAPSLEVVDIQGDYVSFDDLVSALEGTAEEVEGGRLYDVQAKVFSLQYGKGYSSVNESPEPYALKVSPTDENVTMVEWSSPILFNEELFVPIKYVERLLELDYKDGVFEQNGEPLVKGEDFVVVTPPTEEEQPSKDEVVQKPVTPDAGNSNTTEEPTDKPSQEEPLTVKTIFVNKHSVKLEVGQSDKVNAVVDPFNVPDATISWSSSDSSVATVDKKGNIYAVSEGAATVTVTSNMNPSVKATVTVTVTPPPVVLAKSVSVSQTWIDLEVGGSVKVSASVAPADTTNKTIQWSSENSSVASVDSNGNIVAKGEGYTRIVATSASNSSATAYIEVSVKAKPAPTPTPNPEPTPTPNPEPTPTPNPEPTPTPSTPTYIGNSVMSQLLNEGFWQGMGTNVFWSPYGSSASPSLYDVEVAAYNGAAGGVDLYIKVSGLDWDNCFTYANKALVKIIPSGASTIINALKSGQAGTWTFDGRKVTVHYSGEAYINIYG